MNLRRARALENKSAFEVFRDDVLSNKVSASVEISRKTAFSKVFRNTASSNYQEMPPDFT